MKNTIMDVMMSCCRHLMGVIGIGHLCEMATSIKVIMPLTNHDKMDLVATVISLDEWSITQPLQGIRICPNLNPNLTKTTKPIRNFF